MQIQDFACNTAIIAVTDLLRSKVCRTVNFRNHEFKTVNANCSSLHQTFVRNNAAALASEV
jgi:hypothetical protein